MDLKGAASSHNMYLYGGDQLTVPIESLLPPVITSQPQLTGIKASFFIWVILLWYDGRDISLMEYGMDQYCTDYLWKLSTEMNSSSNILSKILKAPTKQETQADKIKTLAL